MAQPRYGTLILLLAAFVSVGQAHAQFSRTAVSVSGVDTNDCSVAFPCRSLARAMDQTVSGGEIIVLTSAGYGPFTINKSVSVIAAPGVYAGITASSGTAVTISLGSADRAVIRGLTLEGVGAGDRGVYGFGGEVHIENTVVNGFNYGIANGSYTVTIADSVIRNNRIAGILIANSGARAIIERVQVKSNTDFGIVIQDGAKGTVRDSVVTGNSIGLSALFANTVLNIDETLSSRNSAGVLAHFGGVVRVSNSVVVDNTSSGLRNDSATLESWGNNIVAGNLSQTFGTITTVSQQ